MSFRRKAKKVAALVLAATMTLGLASCGQGGSAKKDTIRIGYINPTTGPLAGNGEGCDWAVKQITDYGEQNPITVDGKEMDLILIVN